MKFSDFEENIRQSRLQIGLPVFPKSPEELERRIRSVMKKTDEDLLKYVKQDLAKVTFETAIAALDQIFSEGSPEEHLLGFVKETHPSSEMREKATELSDVVQKWAIEIQYREDIFAVIKAFKDATPNLRQARPDLGDEDIKFFEDTWRDYKRAGFLLSREDRKEVETLQKELAEVELKFETNINQASATLEFSKNQLAGLSEDFLTTILQPNGQYQIKVHVPPQYGQVMDHCSIEATRQKLSETYYRLAVSENEVLLDQMIALRDRIARKLGYPSWADYKMETRMAGSAKRAVDFLIDLRERLASKFKSEHEEIRSLKAQETKNASAQIKIWDVRYFMEKLRMEKFNIHKEELRAFFPMDSVVKGVFSIYEELFGIKLIEVDPPEKYVGDLRLFYVEDQKSHRPLGAIYLDLYPREGKYNHFAQFTLCPGRALAEQSYRRPVVALVCNFPEPTATKPSLLSHDDVETFFHEFGHGLHSLTTQAKYERFAGTSVERDFVEAPSQMLEEWSLDPQVLNRFAADYRDPSKKIDSKILNKMKEAKLATVALHYRRQIGFALADLMFHAPGDKKSCREIANNEMRTAYFEPPENSNYAAHWGHMAGYDGGYYGYAWADAIAQDLLSAFKGNLMNFEVGQKLRAEIYSVGGSRRAEESVRKFLGRDWSPEAFYKSLGIAA